MKVLVAGGSGLLGSNILYSLENKAYRLFYTLYRNSVFFQGTPIYLEENNMIGRQLDYPFDVIINTVAITDVDHCEREKNLAWRVNTLFTEQLVYLCKKNGSHIIHISTDQIFDGEISDYVEESHPNPINIYGKSKLAAEQIIQRLLPLKQYTILRTNFFGFNCLNKLSFSEWILEHLQKKEMIEMFDDVYFTPLLVNTLVEFIEGCIKQRLFGTFHCASDGCITKYAFGLRLKDTFDLRYPIKKISISEANLLAKRPKKMCLNNEKIKKILSIKNLSVQREIEKLYNLYKGGYNKRLKKHNEKTNTHSKLHDF